VSRIELSAIGGASDRVNALLAGKMDMIMPVAPQDYDQVRLVTVIPMLWLAPYRPAKILSNSQSKTASILSLSAFADVLKLASCFSGPTLS
jgi:hypothetical protein